VKIYIVRNKQGNFFTGRYSLWSGSLNEARIYTKIQPAKAQITSYLKYHPEAECPDLLGIELKEDDFLVWDMTETTKKSIEKIKRRKKLTKN
jgi:hypothetical protein